MRIRSTLFLLSLIAAGIVQAADRKLLLPIVVSTPTPGAFGSMWVTHTTILNVGADGVFVGGLVPPCSFDECTLAAVRPQATEDVSPYMFGDVPGRFLLVDSASVSGIRVQLRVVDLSRQLNTWGTEIPVIDEADVGTGAIELLGVSADANFRPLLRIYDFDPAPGHAALVRFFKPGDGFDFDTLLQELTVPIDVPFAPADEPGYAQLSITAVPNLPSDGSLRVEVSPLTPNIRLWSFVSMTDNATQHVTLVTPQRSP